MHISGQRSVPLRIQHMDKKQTGNQEYIQNFILKTWDLESVVFKATCYFTVMSIFYIKSKLCLF